MNKIVKHSNYVKSFIDSFTSLILQTFQLNSDIKALEKHKLTNYQRLKKRLFEINTRNQKINN